MTARGESKRKRKHTQPQYPQVKYLQRSEDVELSPLFRLLHIGLMILILLVQIFNLVHMQADHKGLERKHFSLQTVLTLRGPMSRNCDIYFHHADSYHNITCMTHVLWYADDSRTSTAARVCTWSFSRKFEVA